MEFYEIEWRIHLIYNESAVLSAWTTTENTKKFLLRNEYKLLEKVLFLIINF